MGEAYELNSSPKGSVLIINNESFNTTELERREGSDRDYHLLKSIFKDYEFKVKTYYNLDSRNFIKVIRNFVKTNDNWKMDSAILFVMTHGHKDKEDSRAVDLAMTDNRYISSDWIREKFSNRYCKALANKPKIFFIQACRDNADFKGEVIRPRKRSDPDETDPLVNDLLIVNACLPGYGAHRNSRNGSWFIQELCKAIRFYGESSHLHELLNVVDSSLRERFIREKGNCYQGIHFENWSFNKLFFFSNNAYSVHKIARALVRLSPIGKRKDKSRDRKRPSASKPLLVSKDDISRAIKDREKNQLEAFRLLRALKSFQQK